MSSNAELAVQALQALTSGRIDQLEAIYAPDFVFHSGTPDRASGHAALRRRALILNSSLYDPMLCIEFVVEHADLVVVRWRGRAVHKGDLLGVPASGTMVEAGGITIFRFDRGRIVEEWTEFDGLGLARQISQAGDYAAALRHITA